MRVILERTGGFAGIKLRTSLDSESLTESQARCLRELVEKSRFFDLPLELHAPNSGADRFQYRVTVESEKGSHTVVASETAVPPEMRPLLDWLVQRARR